MSCRPQAAPRPPTDEGLTLDALISAIGLPAVAKLSQAFGGQRLYIPKAPRLGQKLVAVLGLEDAQRLADLYAGERLLDVPVRLGRIAEIQELRRNHPSLSAADIARRVHVSRRTVLRALRLRPILGPVGHDAQGASGGQYDLFDAG